MNQFHILDCSCILHSHLLLIFLLFQYQLEEPLGIYGNKRKRLDFSSMPWAQRILHVISTRGILHRLAMRYRQHRLMRFSNQEGGSIYCEGILSHTRERRNDRGKDWWHSSYLGFIYCVSRNFCRFKEAKSTHWIERACSLCRLSEDGKRKETSMKSLMKSISFMNAYKIWHRMQVASSLQRFGPLS